MSDKITFSALDTLIVFGQIIEFAIQTTTSETAISMIENTTKQHLESGKLANREIRAVKAASAAAIERALKADSHDLIAFIQAGNDAAERS